MSGGMEAGGGRLEAYSEASGGGLWAIIGEACHTAGGCGVSQKIINSSQAKGKVKDHFLFQISNTRVFHMRGIKFSRLEQVDWLFVFWAGEGSRRGMSQNPGVREFQPFAASAGAV